MNLSIFRIQSVFQEWEFLTGLAQDADLPRDVRQDVARLVTRRPYSWEIHLSLPARPDSGEEALQRGDHDDPLLDATPPVWMTRGCMHWKAASPGQVAVQNEREMGICASCEAMLAEPDPTRRHGYGALVAVCVEKAPVGRRCIRMRCLECGKEWLKIEPTEGRWAVSWVEG